jgi:hypothetical protein
MKHPCFLPNQVKEAASIVMFFGMINSRWLRNGAEMGEIGAKLKKWPHFHTNTHTPHM